MAQRNGTEGGGREEREPFDLQKSTHLNDVQIDSQTATTLSQCAEAQWHLGVLGRITLICARAGTRAETGTGESHVPKLHNLQLLHLHLLDLVDVGECVVARSDAIGVVCGGE